MADADKDAKREDRGGPGTTPIAGPGTPAGTGKQPARKPAQEIGGRGGPDPTRYGDWEIGGRCIDF